MSTIDWGKLGFGYTETDYNIRSTFSNGKWSEPELTDDDHISLHMAATCLHYGQEAFEGMKAFRGKDGLVRLFRPEENAKRLISSAEYLKSRTARGDVYGYGQEGRGSKRTFYTAI